MCGMDRWGRVPTTFGIDMSAFFRKTRVAHARKRLMRPQYLPSRRIRNGCLAAPAALARLTYRLGVAKLAVRCQGSRGLLSGRRAVTRDGLSFPGGLGFPGERNGGHDTIGGYPLRQGAGASVLKRRIGVKGNLDALLATGGVWASVLETLVANSEVDLEFGPPAAGSNAILRVIPQRHDDRRERW